jgi:hypothetical protein
LSGFRDPDATRLCICSRNSRFSPEGKRSRNKHRRTILISESRIDQKELRAQSRFGQTCPSENVPRVPAGLGRPVPFQAVFSSARRRAPVEMEGESDFVSGWRCVKVYAADRLADEPGQAGAQSHLRSCLAPVRALPPTSVSNAAVRTPDNGADESALRSVDCHVQRPVG